MKTRTIFRAEAILQQEVRKSPSPPPKFTKRRDAKVPIVLQLNAVECGAACLAMVLKYYGRDVSLAACRDLCKVGRDGANAHAIAKAARRFGLRPKSYSIPNLKDLGQLKLPAIAHWEFNHFVVIEKWTPKQVEIVDPALGRRIVTLEELNGSFTGIALTFEPTESFAIKTEAKPRSNLSTLGLMARQFFNSAESRWVLGAVVLASVLLQLSTFGITWLTQLIVDGALVKRNTNPMVIAGGGALALLLGIGLVRWLRSWQMARMQAQIDSRVMHGFMAHMLALPFRFFQERTNGDLLSRLSSNVNIRQAITSQTLSTVLDGSLALGSLIALMVLAPGIAALAVGVAALQIIVTSLSVPRLRELSQQSLMARTDTHSYEVEMLNGMMTLKASGADQEAFQHWSGLFTKSLNTDYTRRRFSAFTEAIASSLNTLVPIMLLWVGGWLVLSGQYSFGKMLAMNTLAGTFISPINSLVGNIQDLQMVGIYLDRVRDVLESEPEPTGDIIPNLRGPIELVNVSFRYDTTSARVLDNVSLVIEPGQKVALVGRTGSGKSTLGRLLLGLHRPTDGDILFDGISLDKVDLHALRGGVGVVTQEPSIFSGSIRSNIAFNDPFIPLKVVTEAARLAEISEDIERMPMGYDTWLSENGNSLSGGQRQRVSIARALAHGPDVLLFDEATSHLDAVSERKIENNLSQIPCTRIVIAHRLSTVRDADLILVLDQGKVVERGTHDELMRMGGKYADLVSSQTQRLQPHPYSVIKA